MEKSKDKKPPVYSMKELKAFPEEKRPFFVSRPYVDFGYRGVLGGMSFS